MLAPGVGGASLNGREPCWHVELYLKKCLISHSLISVIKQVLVRELDRRPALLKFVASLTPREQDSHFPEQAFNSALEVTKQEGFI